MRVLVSSVPGWGHVNPIVPLAQAFLDCGDEVVVATGRDACEGLEAAGLKVAPCGLTQKEGMAEFHRRYPEFAGLAPTERSEFMFPRLFGEAFAPPMLADLASIARDWDPAVIICDAAEFAGPVVAAALGVPNVTKSFGALLPPARVAAGGERVASLWNAHGQEPRPYGGMYEHLYLDVYPSSLQPSDWPHIRVRQPLRPTGPTSKAEYELPGLVTESQSAPLVYVTFGTVFSNNAVLSAVVEAACKLSVRAVVTVGPDGDPASLGPQPENVHIARYIPQDQLLPHCAAVVSHAGSGTFLAALAAGLPQVCLPQAADQFLNAAACARSGTGITVAPGDQTAEQVTAALGGVLSDASFRAAAEQVSDEIAAMPSPHEVAELLQSRYG
ncbi:MAG TPA: glycosyltransferase [Acidimicrobiia bacterium]|nr:glycosyltransferase [Acidimicrobiia bacterium]